MAFFLLLGGVLTLGACNQHDNSQLDAALIDQRPFSLDNVPLGEFSAILTIDFVAQGCPVRTSTSCEGVVPLKLSFSAVLLGEPTSIKWDLGDGSPSESGKVVAHTYEKTGRFTVTMVASGADGTVSEQKSEFVVVQPAGPGSSCATAQACESKTCICRSTCPFPLDSGFCLQECQSLACYLPDTVCVDLSRGNAGTADPWRKQLCLPVCASDTDCTRPGFSCSLAPGIDSWHKVCLPPFPRFIGLPCRTAAGVPDPSLCLGGICLDIGASGYCSASCSPQGCPDGSRCIQMTGLSPQSFCMLRCTESTCQSDPLLACETPSPAGYYGFEIIGPQDPAGAEYCAVKRCTADDQCGVIGRCDKSKGGFCVR
jgi:hypothetical protein